MEPKIFWSARVAEGADRITQYVIALILMGDWCSEVQC